MSNVWPTATSMPTPSCFQVRPQDGHVDHRVVPQRPPGRGGGLPAGRQALRRGGVRWPVVPEHRGVLRRTEQRVDGGKQSERILLISDLSGKSQRMLHFGENSRPSRAAVTRGPQEGRRAGLCEGCFSFPPSYLHEIEWNSLFLKAA